MRWWMMKLGVAGQALLISRWKRGLSFMFSSTALLEVRKGPLCGIIR